MFFSFIWYRGHNWFPNCKNETYALTATGILTAYGLIANLDHTEGWCPQLVLFFIVSTYRCSPVVVFNFVALSCFFFFFGLIFSLDQIPNFQVFNSSYRVGRLLAPWMQTALPWWWAGLVVAEGARNSYLPQNVTGAWQDVLLQTVGVWETLVRHHAPAGLVFDWQLELDNYSAYVSEFRVLIVPNVTLSAQARAGLARFQQAGGLVLSLPAQPGWLRPHARQGLGQALVDQLQSMAGPSPVSLSAAPAGVHVVAHRQTTSPGLVVFVSNEFTWAGERERTHPTGPPAAVSGLSLNVTVADPERWRAVDIVANTTLLASPAGQGQLLVHLPVLEAFLAIGLEST